MFQIIIHYLMITSLIFCGCSWSGLEAYGEARHYCDLISHCRAWLIQSFILLLFTHITCLGRCPHSAWLTGDFCFTWLYELVATHFNRLTHICADVTKPLTQPSIHHFQSENEAVTKPSATLYKIRQRTLVLSHCFVFPLQCAASYFSYCILQASMFSKKITLYDLLSHI